MKIKTPSTAWQVIEDLKQDRVNLPAMATAQCENVYVGLCSSISILDDKRYIMIPYDDSYLVYRYNDA